MRWDTGCLPTSRLAGARYGMGGVTGPVRGLLGCGCGAGAGGHGVVDRPDADRVGLVPPEADTPEKRLRYYARQFALVEVDATYYALPAEQTAALWAARTPAAFTFNVKAFSLFTHH